MSPMLVHGHMNRFGAGVHTKLQFGTCYFGALIYDNLILVIKSNQTFCSLVMANNNYCGQETNLRVVLLGKWP